MIETVLGLIANYGHFAGIVGVVGGAAAHFFTGKVKLIMLAVAAVVVVGIFVAKQFEIAHLHTAVAEAKAETATEHAAAETWKGKFEGADAREKAVLMENTHLADQIRTVTADAATLQRAVDKAAGELAALQVKSAETTATLLKRIEEHATPKDHDPVPDGMRFTLISLLADQDRAGGDGASTAGPNGSPGGEDQTQSRTTRGLR